MILSFILNSPKLFQSPYLSDCYRCYPLRKSLKVLKQFGCKGHLKSNDLCQSMKDSCQKINLNRKSTRYL